MNQIIYGNNDDSTINFPQGYGQSSRSSSQPEGNTHDSDEDLEVANHRQLFGDAPVEDTDRVCADLQKKLALDPDHLKITLLTSKRINLNIKSIVDNGKKADFGGDKERSIGNTKDTIEVAKI
ncbi:hypothetical protein PGT21_011618 [Puccinia graminis f. sp. tritici]|uniref:Uncharacterized protein n=1 Tax=Puccinia graminis f. sp. tritici TaxID=56615 RepID=A0A5B0M1G3_PUCGR|nr:hypothetical protein PGT21_011618 [Puccinia graminis f. sp. tritici]